MDFAVVSPFLSLVEAFKLREPERRVEPSSERTADAAAEPSPERMAELSPETPEGTEDAPSTGVPAWGASNHVF
jgi:hypothetical protein